MNEFFDSPSPFISYGGMVIGLGILLWYVLRWWWKGRKTKGGKGKGDTESGSRDWRDLAPLGVGMALGSLAAACTGGILGAAAYWISRTNQTAGDTAVLGTTGADTSTITQGDLPTLTGGGAVITMLLVVGLAALWKRGLTKRLRQQIGAGGWAGVSLALSAGGAGVFARTIVPLANSIGDSAIGSFL